MVVKVLEILLSDITQWGKLKIVLIFGTLRAIVI